MKLRVTLVLLVMVALASLSSTSYAEDTKPSDVWKYWTLDQDPLPPAQWKMTPGRTKYIGDGCWRDWKVTKCTPYGNYGKYRYVPGWNK